MGREASPKISEVYFPPRLLSVLLYEETDIRRDAAIAQKRYFTYSHYPHVTADVYLTSTRDVVCTLGGLVRDMEEPTGC